jgi:long-chain acyl-CoA synthetase
MSGAVLLTGSTGFLGMELLTRLLEREHEQVAVLVRADDGETARERLRCVLAQLYDAPPPAAARIRAVRGDLKQPGLGLSEEDRLWIVESVDRIIHCAASISFELPLEQARDTNVAGIRRVVDLAREIDAKGTLRRLVHVSTAYVSGRHAGAFGEADLDLRQTFRNSYEQSKHEAEHELAEARDLPIAIARPSMVVGHSTSGWTPTFNVIYWPIRAYERGLLKAIPARPDSIVDFVPVDYVAAGIVALLDTEDARGAYHLVAGERALRAEELLALLSSPRYGGPRGGPTARFVPVGEASELPIGAHPLLGYFDVRCEFRDERGASLLREAGVDRPEPANYLQSMLQYARTTNWGKHPMPRSRSMARPA